MRLLYPRHDGRFDYPVDRLYLLRVILAAAQIKEPNSQDNTGDATRFVIKRGHTTLTTIGRLNGFESYTRRYSLLRLGRGGGVPVRQRLGSIFSSW